MQLCNRTRSICHMVHQTWRGERNHLLCRLAQSCEAALAVSLNVTIVEIAEPVDECKGVFLLWKIKFNY